ncbi:hypothetical protein MMC10_008085 [Thelotrema lepadinum]|nr:hypothetical protein [Thelotrema lepadinum]
MPPLFGRINFSILAIPAYYAIVMTCHVYATFLLVKADKERNVYDNRNPRAATPESLRKVMGPPAYDRYSKAKSAHTNGHENFPLFVAAMLAGNFAGLDSRSLNIMAAGLLMTRVAYSFSYILAKTRGQSFIRSLVFNVGTFMKMYILVKAALATAPTAVQRIPTDPHTWI